MNPSIALFSPAVPNANHLYLVVQRLLSLLPVSQSVSRSQTSRLCLHRRVQLLLRVIGSASSNLDVPALWRSCTDVSRGSLAPYWSYSSLVRYQGLALVPLTGPLCRNRYR